eukprot:942130-Lingulodinium_polyedra.AAC.1
MRAPRSASARRCSRCRPPLLARATSRTGAQTRPPCPARSATCSCPRPAQTGRSRCRWRAAARPSRAPAEPDHGARMPRNPPRRTRCGQRRR